MTVKSEPSGKTPGGFLKPYGASLSAETLNLALTHRSWAYEQGETPAPHNERLEFLGDAVLGLAVTSKLFHDFPELPEGELSRRRAALVSSHSLAGIARAMKLGPQIRLGKGEIKGGGSNKESILADVVEALIGAVYVEHGPHEAERFVHALIQEQFLKLDELVLFFDPKTTLQEEADARGIPRPEYSVEASGPNHDRTYTARVTLVGFSGSGSATNKKAAELLAAKQVVIKMREVGKLVTDQSSEPERA